MHQPPETAADFYKDFMRKPWFKLILLLILTACLNAGTFDLVSRMFALDPPDKTKTGMSMIDYSVSHQELYRATRNDTLLSRSTYRDQHLQFNYHFKRFDLYTSWIRKVFDIDDLFNSDYTITDFKPISHKFDLTLDTRIHNWRIKPGISFFFSSTKDTLFIPKYPSSDQSALNNYFFDLLPGTFGDSIRFNHSGNSIKGELQASHAKFTVYVSYQYMFNRLIESHENTSSYPGLAGPRESLAILDNTNIRLKVNYAIDPKNSIWGGADLSVLPLDWHHSVYPGDPIPSEIIQLAGGRNSHVSAQLGYRTKFDNFRIESTVSIGNLNISDTASTPVMGYFMAFFPISHQADLTLNSRYALARIHADYFWKIGRSAILPRLDIIAMRSWSDVDFSALLEFGLEDIQVRERYIHASYLIAPGCDAHIFLNQDLFLDLKLEQMIPYIKTVSPEPPPPPPPDGTKRYGGLSVEIGVSMTW